MTIDYDDGVYSGTIRVIRHDQNATYGGDTFIAGFFGVTPPPEDETRIPLLRVIVSDVDATVRQQIERLDPRYPATITVNFHRLSELPSLTTAPVLPYTGTLRNVKTDRYSITASIETFDNISREPLTPFRMSPAYGFNSLDV